MSPLDLLLLGLLVCGLLCLLRVVLGPTPADRTVGVDILGILMVGFCAVLTVMTGKDLYMIVGLSWSLLAFVGALALAKHLEGKRYHD
ncbi:MAG: monovalent cation/H+ antiporter complex subunit F [Planctomycetota bacterium]|nr:monovalent cation/H+ antiporter complex subunit F [Planctomycetota bacterium]